MSDDAMNVWADVPDWGGGVGARRLVRARGASLGGSLWEFQPGASQFVYHFHHGTEEFLIVLRGRPTVRMHDGDHELTEGDVVPFPRGPKGGHQIRNDGESTARVPHSCGACGAGRRRVSRDRKGCDDRHGRAPVLPHGRRS